MRFTIRSVTLNKGDCAPQYWQGSSNQPEQNKDTHVRVHTCVHVHTHTHWQEEILPADGLWKEQHWLFFGSPDCWSTGRF